MSLPIITLIVSPRWRVFINANLSPTGSIMIVVSAIQVLITRLLYVIKYFIPPEASFYRCFPTYHCILPVSRFELMLCIWLVIFYLNILCRCNIHYCMNRTNLILLKKNKDMISPLFPPHLIVFVTLSTRISMAIVINVNTN